MTRNFLKRKRMFNKVFDFQLKIIFKEKKFCFSYLGSYPEEEFWPPTPKVTKMKYSIENIKKLVILKVIKQFNGSNVVFAD